MLLHTIRQPWKVYRSEIATKDFPSTTLTYDAPDDVADRLVARLLDTSDVAIPVINLQDMLGINILEIRTHYKNATDTCTMDIFAARQGELEVKFVAEIVWAAGTQETGAATTRYFGKTSTITSYWPTAITKNAAESGTGIATIEFDTLGYERFWIGFDAISSSDNVTVEISGY